MKSAFNVIYPPIFLPVGLLVKFLNSNHINSFYGKFRIQENSFRLVLSRSVMTALLRGAKLALRKLQDHLLFSAVVSSSVHRKRQKNEISLSAMTIIGVFESKIRFRIAIESWSILDAHNTPRSPGKFVLNPLN